MHQCWIGEVAYDFTRAFTPKVEIPMHILKHSFPRNQESLVANINETALLELIHKANNNNDWARLQKLLGEYMYRL
jgi:hypothetical protein